MRRLRYFDDPWLLRVITLIVIIASYLFVYRPAEAERADIDAAAIEATSRAQLAEDALAHAPQYMLAAKNIERELGQVSLDKDQDHASYQLLIDLDQVARRHSVLLLGIEPQRNTPNAAGLDLVVHLRGHYADLLEVCGDLALTRNVVKLRSLDFIRDDKTVQVGISPYVDATVRVMLLSHSAAPTQDRSLDHGDPS